MSSTSSKFGNIFVSLVVSALLVILWDQAPTRTSISSILAVAEQQYFLGTSKKYAYATFLEAPIHVGNNNGSFEEDSNFIASRVLSYQLLHSNISGQAKIPFVVLVTEEVSEEKRTRLRDDGAIVYVVEKIHAPSWMLAASGRWREMLTKLRIFELTEYDKVCYMDLNVVVKEHLDEIFQDKATYARTTPDERTVADEPPMLSRYMLAAHSDTSDPESKTFDAGFLVFEPSKELFNYYLAVSKIKNRTSIDVMDQDLLNHVHRLNGDMPWQRLWSGWNTSSATSKELKSGTKSFHDKYWNSGAKVGAILSSMWQEQRRNMEEHWGR